MCMQPDYQGKVSCTSTPGNCSFAIGTAATATYVLVAYSSTDVFAEMYFDIANKGSGMAKHSAKLRHDNSLAEYYSNEIWLW